MIRKEGHRCPTLEEYVLIATDHQAVEVFRRTEGG
jgi:hypothetical protein